MVHVKFFGTNITHSFHGGGWGSNGNMSQVDIGQVVCKLGVKLLHSGQPLLPLVPALLVVKEVGVCWLSIWIGYHNQGIVHLFLKWRQEKDKSHTQHMKTQHTTLIYTHKCSLTCTKTAHAKMLT